MNGGTCVDGKGNLTSCICAPTYTGERCESLYCPSDYCCNGGICNVTATSHSLKCTCPPGFKGKYCQTDIDYCSDLQSLCAGLDCIEGIGTEFHCLCPEECCLNCSSPCSAGPCITNGTCSAISHKFHCTSRNFH